MISKDEGSDQMDPRPDVEEGPIGFFPTWSWVYGTVLVYGALVILVLWILTRVLDPVS
jgi:hypothetical protein